jgi:CDP-glycerol glycerophosphotransferase
LGGDVLHHGLGHAKKVARRVLGQLGRHSLSVAWRLLPAGEGVVIYAGASLEPNGLVTAAVALRRGVRPIALLLDDEVPESRARAALESCGAGGNEIAVIRRRSLRGIITLLRAPTVMFTQMLNGGITPPHDRKVINIWHGDGPKTTVPEHQASTRRASHYIVSGTARWGSQKASSFNLKPEELLLIGNPRTSLFSSPSNEEMLADLGLRPGVPIILWAPTYRATAGAKGWSDSPQADAFAAVLADGGKALRDAADSSGRQIALRPHPRDKLTFADVRFPVISDEALLALRANIYSFLPHVACLVTDYSSVWTDFLLLDRPVAFFCPDLEEYAGARGLGPGFEELLPGPLFRSDGEFLEYVASAALDDEEQQIQRRGIRDAIGLVLSASPAEDLINWAMPEQPSAHRRRS